MSRPLPEVDLCALTDISDPGSRGFEVDPGTGQKMGLFVVRKGQVLAAYRNRCPHTGAPLEWLADQFLDSEGSFIQCAMHGALFRPEDGYCLHGPCAGQSLEPIQVGLFDGRLRARLRGVGSD